MSQKHFTAEHIADILGADLTGEKSKIITDVTHDSRQAGSGALFTAIQGLTMDGHRFVDDVMRRGASGILSEIAPPEGFAGVWLQVKDARRAMAAAAAAIHGNPTSELNLVGITGTNGKTTTTYLVLAIANANDQKPAMLTTVEYRIGQESRPAVRTTPEASDTQRFMREAVDSGCTVAVMEASSQAIHLRRCDYLQFRVAIFTNLTRDHLDYHGTMENYFDAKKELFDGRLGVSPGSSIINVDDEWGRKLAGELRQAGQKIVTCSQLGEADFTAANVSVSLSNGTEFDLVSPIGTVHVNSPLVGRPHVYNMLSAAAAGVELGYELEKIASGFGKCTGAPGRFERVETGKDFAVVVDYAHSDDALLNTLETASGLAKGRIITVFGCGGDRDKSKRSPMGKIAGDLSDLVFITSDNPRTEDPLQIISEIEAGIKESDGEYVIEPDRKKAIFRAIHEARKDDVVIIAGKGHETYQIVGGDKFHFDDREIAIEAVESLEF